MKFKHHGCLRSTNSANHACMFGQVATRLDRVKSVSTTERIMATTMSVDEYFDELIASTFPSR